MHEHEIRPDDGIYKGLVVVERGVIREALRTILGASCPTLAVAILGAVAILPFYQGASDPWTRCLQAFAVVGVVVVAIAVTRRPEGRATHGATIEEPAESPAP
jgi:hypothetical protein